MLVQIFDFFLHVGIVLMKFIFLGARTKAAAQPRERSAHRHIIQRVHFFDLQSGHVLLSWIQRLQLRLLLLMSHLLGHLRLRKLILNNIDPDKPQQFIPGLLIMHNINRLPLTKMVEQHAIRPIRHLPKIFFKI